MLRFEGKNPAPRLAAFVLAGGLFAGAAYAGESPAPVPQPAKSPDDARCSALGHGFFAVSGSDACIRISGYVAAGADFGGALPSAGRGAAPFGATTGAVMRTRAGASLDARFDTPMGPGRIYVDGGHERFGP
jgi:hypothetical protein